MAITVLSLRQHKADLVGKSRLIVGRVEAEKRSMMNPEETSQFNAIAGEIEQCDLQIKSVEKLESEERALAVIADRRTEANPVGTGLAADAKNKPEFRSTFTYDVSNWGKQTGAEIRSHYTDYLCGRRTATEMRSEMRALQADSDTTGGFLVSPQEMLNDLIIFLNNLVFVRKMSSVYPVAKSESLGIPSWDADPTYSWTSEIKTGTVDSSARTGKRELRPHPLATLIQISRTLLERSMIPAEQLIRERLAYVFSIAEEQAFLTGNGVDQPLGMMTASPNGISTGRDVSAANTTSTVTVDGLINAKYNLKAQYLSGRNLTWGFHRTTVAMIRTLKDGIGQYLWRDGFAQDKQPTILDVPFFMSEYMPNTYTTGQYVGFIGDLTYYYIADAMTLQLQRLDELYAATNQVGFIGRLETDAMPVLEQAFSRVKLA